MNLLSRLNPSADSFLHKTTYYPYSFKNDHVLRLNDYFDTGLLPASKVRGVTEDDTFFTLVEPDEAVKFLSASGTNSLAAKGGSSDNPFLLTFHIYCK